MQGLGLHPVLSLAHCSINSQAMSATITYLIDVKNRVLV